MKQVSLLIQEMIKVCHLWSDVQGCLEVPRTPHQSVLQPFMVCLIYCRSCRRSGQGPNDFPDDEWEVESDPHKFRRVLRVSFFTQKEEVTFRGTGTGVLDI